MPLTYLTSYKYAVLHVQIQVPSLCSHGLCCHTPHNTVDGRCSPIPACHSLKSYESFWQLKCWRGSYQVKAAKHFWVTELVQLCVWINKHGHRTPRQAVGRLCSRSLKAHKHCSYLTRTSFTLIFMSVPLLNACLVMMLVAKPETTEGKKENTHREPESARFDEKRLYRSYPASEHVSMAHAGFCPVR